MAKDWSFETMSCTKQPRINLSCINKQEHYSLKRQCHQLCYYNKSSNQIFSSLFAIITDFVTQLIITVKKYEGSHKKLCFSKQSALLCKNLFNATDRVGAKSTRRILREKISRHRIPDSKTCGIHQPTFREKFYHRNKLCSVINISESSNDRVIK